MQTGTIAGLACGLALVGLALVAMCAVPAAGSQMGSAGDRGDLLERLAEAKRALADTRADDGLRLACARLLYEAGDFEQAGEAVAPLLERPEPGVEATVLGARIAYLTGKYEDSEALFTQALSLDPENRSAFAGLVFTYYQTNRYDRCRDLPEASREDTRIPHLDVMLAFGEEEPNQITWEGERRTTIPFLATDPLPIIEVVVDGRAVEALIDTGGDTFILDTEIAESLGIDIVASMPGMFAGGKEAEVGFAKARTLAMGGVTLRSVPISVLPTKGFSMGEHVIGGIVGTGVLRQFLSTIDYPNAQLILRDRSENGSSAFREEGGGRAEYEVPFYLQSTHILLARGSLNGYDGLLFHVDSGLAGEAAFGAPLETLEYVGIPVPEVTVHEDSIGGGGGGFALGTFPVATLGLGPLVQRDLVGSYGGLPPGSYRRLGFITDGLVSHNFLRRYSWTIDFSRMRMVFRR